MNYSHHHFDELDSTSTYLKKHFDDVSDFTFISADYQSIGRGRENRKWFSPIGENLLFSFLIKDKEFIQIFNLLSVASAYVISQYLFDAFHLTSEIKWPNDIYIQGHKMTGILLEGHNSNNEMDGLIIGIGINVNQTVFEPGLSTHPTSLKKELNQDIDISALSKDLFARIYSYFQEVKKGDKKFLLYAREHNYLKDKTVVATINNTKCEVKVLDINEDCSLKVLKDGKIYNLISGEVTFHL